MVIKHPLIIIHSFFIFLLTPRLILGQERAKKIDSISRSIHSKNPKVAISIGFIDQEVVYFFNYGTLSRSSQQKPSENTIYEIGSITKLLTANLIAQAQLEQKLNIDDPIGQYLSEYDLPEHITNKVKLSDLASHQSGLPDFDFQKLMLDKPKQPLDITQEVLHQMLNDSTQLLDFGSYRYSNISYVLLGRVLEHVYQKKFNQILQEKILNPVKLHHTLTQHFNVENKLTGYDIEGHPQDFFNWNNITAPAGLLKSNTKDMLKLVHTLMNGNQQLNKAAKLCEQTYFKNTERAVGLGMQMEKNNDDLFFYKTGDTFSCSSILIYDKKYDWGMVVLVNQHNSGLIRDLVNTNYEAILKPN